MDPDREVLRRLEESLWRAETRFDAAYLAEVLAPDFFEFGRSGRVYRRADTLAVPAAPIVIVFPLEGFTVTWLDEQVALVTYVSEITYDTVERSNRASVWRRAGARWQLVFHQGTRTTR